MRRRDFLGAAAALAAGACTGVSDPRSSTDRPDAAPGASTPTTTTGPTTTGPTTTGPTTTEPGQPTVEPLEEPAAVLTPGVFALGVASGDPDAESVVLWTRLVGELPGSVPVLWEVSHDEEFTRLAATGIVELDAEAGHSAHVVASGLRATSRYWYRFRVGGQVSSTGRTRTLPAVGEPVERFRLGVSSCQRRDDAYWSAHHDLAAADIDLVVWLGDFIYSTSSRSPIAGREHRGPDPRTLSDYRARYAEYRSDPALQASSAAHPWMLTWDDHEVENDYDASVDPARRAAAYQAWWEHQPTRLPAPGATFDIYRHADLGALGRLVLTDVRQYADGSSLLGDTQKSWLAGALDHGATWTILASPVLLGGILVPTRTEPLLWYTWDGYPADRAWLADQLGRRPNRLCVSGDLHTAAVTRVRADPADRRLPVVATEFMAPAISSRFPQQYVDLLPFIPLANAHIDHLDPSNGWLLLELTPDRATAEFRVLGDVALPDQGLATGIRFEVSSGDPAPRRL